MHAIADDGSLLAKRKHPVVSDELLREIHDWRKEGAKDIDVITCLHCRAVPPNFDYHCWCPGDAFLASYLLINTCSTLGKTETEGMLRSILSQLQYILQLLSRMCRQVSNKT